MFKKLATLFAALSTMVMVSSNAMAIPADHVYTLESSEAYANACYSHVTDKYRGFTNGDEGFYIDRYDVNEWFNTRLMQYSSDSFEMISLKISTSYGNVYVRCFFPSYSANPYIVDAIEINELWYLEQVYNDF